MNYRSAFDTKALVPLGYRFSGVFVEMLIVPLYRHLYPWRF